MTRDDVAKVTGFGSARLPGYSVKTTTTQRESAARYTAPEYIFGKLASDKMDVYSMGLMLYEAIGGTHPIVPKPAPLATICELQRDREPPPLAAIMPPGFPGELSALVQRAMFKDPAKRCSMRELADGLAKELGVLLAWRRRAARSVPLPNRALGLAPTEAVRAWPDTPPHSEPGGSNQTSAAGGVPPGGIAAPAHDTRRPAPAGVRGAAGPIRGGTAPDAKRSTSDHDERRDAVLPPETLRTPSHPSVPTTSRGTEIMVVPSQAPPASSVRTEAVSRATEAISFPAERRSTGAPVESAARPSRVARAHPVLVVGAVLIVTGLAAASWLLFSGAPYQSDRTPTPAGSPPPPLGPTATSTARAATAPSTSPTVAPSARRPRAGAPQRPR